MPESSFDTPYNVVAAFERGSTADTAVELLEHEGVPPSAIHVHRDPETVDADVLAELRAEMQDELVDSWAAPAFYMTEEQAKGALPASLLFALPGVIVGVVVGAAWAMFDDTLLGWWGQILLSAFVGALGGGTIGLLAGGGLKPRFDAAEDPARPYDDRRAAAERDVLVAVHSQQRELAERAAELLRGVGAERVDLVDGRGVPLPPQARHPRPADPEGWWWRRAGRG
jgi:hypothetical protein